MFVRSLHPELGSIFCLEISESFLTYSSLTDGGGTGKEIRKTHNEPHEGRSTKKKKSERERRTAKAEHKSLTMEGKVCKTRSFHQQTQPTDTNGPLILTAPHLLTPIFGLSETNRKEKPALVVCFFKSAKFWK